MAERTVISTRGLLNIIQHLLRASHVHSMLLALIDCIITPSEGRHNYLRHKIIK